MLKKFRNSGQLSFLILITIVLGLAYGICIPRLSFYGDDWIYVYNYHLAGAKSFTWFTQWDRPYSAWIYVLTSALFGEAPIGYHLYVFVMRWLSVVLFWRILKETFRESRIADTAALLFAVYPGFQQQPIAVEYVMHFTSLVLVLLSVFLMQKAFFMKGMKAAVIYLISLIAGLTAIFTCEYFVGLELARPLFMILMLRGRGIRPQKKKTLLYMIPYAAAAAFFFIWRIFIFSFQTYEAKLVTALRADFLNGIKLLVLKVIRDLITALPSAYRMIFSRPAGISLMLTILTIVLTAGGTFFHLQWSRRTEQPSRPAEMLLLGTAVLLLSGIPFWGTFIDVTTDFPWDRPLLSFSPGAAILIAVLLHLAFRPVFFRFAAALITALCVLFHIRNGEIYIGEAAKMNDYFWQLAWRVPGLEKGTILVSDEIPLDRYSDNDLSPVVNWQYAPESTGLRYDYKYFDLDLREGFYYTDPNVPVPVDHTYRTHAFTSSTEKTLGIFYKKSGCLQIIDQGNTRYPGLPESLIRTAPISDPGLIISEGETHQPPAAIGREPEHGYCYYFQKTSLSLQAGEKGAAYENALATVNKGLRPVFSPDLAPVVLALLEAGDVEHAEEMLARTPAGSGDLNYLCGYWKQNISEADASESLNDFYSGAGCK